MKTKKELFPRVRVKTALSRFESQAELGRELGVSRYYINNIRKKKYLPETLAHRYVWLFGKRDVEK
jgi:DNA-binding XRE family transcriptional regulator